MADSYKIGQERTADGTVTRLRINGELHITTRVPKVSGTLDLFGA